jgi:AcrR family transcriptional regulator
MDQAVNGGRRTGRGSRARATRRRIIDAAAQLFIAEGYTTTTLEQIAERAGVAVQTVYFHFGNKRTVLKEAVDVAAVGDDEPVPLLDRPLYRQLAEERDPHRLLAAWTSGAREIFARVAPIMRVVRDAAGADPDMAAQWRSNQQQRATAYAVFSQQLADLGALKAGLSQQDAVDVLLALVSFEVYLTLTGRGWSPQRWQTWMATTLAATLLEETAGPSPSGTKPTSPPVSNATSAHRL